MRKVRTITLEGILFRLPNELDLAAVRDGILPIAIALKTGREELPVIGPGAEEYREKQREDLAEKAIPMIDGLLMRCSKRPRLVDDPALVATDLVMDLNELTITERTQIFTALIGNAGFTKEAAETVDPLSETGRASSSSTPSADATGSALRS